MLQVHTLAKSYPDGWRLEGISFAVQEGQVLCLLGPSGCGKTTLLRLIAGLETPDGGAIVAQGTDVTHLPPHRRGFGFMFQDYALFPHKNVYDNVVFGLRMAGWDKAATRRRAAEVLELVGLAGFGHRDVSQLSGGERQRIALARSLAPQPRLLLLDEPLGALDRALRERLMEELPLILRQAGVTTITVTHDQEEALAIGDCVLVMRDGRVEQYGTPQEIYRRPASSWVARFLGMINLLPARIVGAGEAETPLGVLTFVDSNAAAPGTTGELLVRPQAARWETGQQNVFYGEVVRCSFRGSHYRFDIRTPSGVTLSFEWLLGQAMPDRGQRVQLSLDPAGLLFLG